MNIAVPMMRAKMPGTRMMAAIVKVRLLNGFQNSGSAVI
ncbi:hypothetical protein ABIF62_002860 [Bradyrhizobium japonicum]